MTVKTIPGVVYVLSAPSACTVTTTNENNSQITLCSVSAGGQKAFQAISLSVEVSDANAAIVPFDKAASVPFGLDGGCDATTLADMVEAATRDYEERSMETETGKDNLTAHLITLIGARVPSGKLKSISLQARSNSPQYLAEEVYLALYEKSEDGKSWVKVGLSLEAVRQTVGMSSTWLFAGARLHGRELRIQPIKQSGDPFVESGDVVLGLIGSQTEDGCKVDTLAYVPQMTMVYDVPVEKYATTEAMRETQAELEEEIAAQAARAVQYKGSVATYDELPKSGQKVGDMWNVADTGANYIWDGEEWDDAAPFLGGYAKKDEVAAEVEEVEGQIADAVMKLSEDIDDAVNEFGGVEKSLASEAGNANLTPHYVTLASARVPSGKVNALTLQCRSDHPDYLAGAVFLRVYEEGEDGEFALAGVSTEAVQQTVGTSSTWHFDGMELHGRSVRIQPVLDAGDEWTTQGSVVLGLRVFATEDGSLCEALQYAPQYEWAYQNEVVSRFTPRAHAENETIHITEEEKAALHKIVENPPKDGAPGKDGEPGAKGDKGDDGAPGADGQPGADGKSAYQIWLEAGNDGDEQQFLESLKGADGQPGADGKPGKDGAPGAKGEKGDDGAPGKDGAPGEKGEPGENGADGQPGEPGKDGKNGVTFTPQVSAEGVLSWTNDGELENPQEVNIKGADGKGFDIPYVINGSSGFAIGHSITTAPLGEPGYHATGLGIGVDISGEQACAFGFTVAASGKRSVVLGNTSSAKGASSTAIGVNAKAQSSCNVAIGYVAVASGQSAVAVGIGTICKEAHTLALGESLASPGTRTQLYLVAEGSELSTRCCEGKAALGYTVDDGSGNIQKSGWIALEELCKNADFTPALK